MNVVLYSRVSTQDQNNDAQRLELVAHCERQGWTVTKEHSDVMSGAKSARPGLDALIADCKTGGIDAIVVVKLDRLGRSLLNVIGLVNRLDKLGVALICTSQGIDTRKNNPCGKMQMGILGVIAEFERDLIRERTKSGLAAVKASGKILGHPSKTLIPNWREVTFAWKTETGGVGLRDLATRIGVGPSTAWRKARECGVI